MAEDDADVCCNQRQAFFALFYCAYLLLVWLTWNGAAVKPMRLMAVFLHEMSHAIACWITGGTVRGIEVNAREGGVTKFEGGCRCCIIPAGYLGCAFWGMVFVVMSAGRKTATAAAVGFIVALLTSLCFRPTRLLVVLNLGYALWTAVCTVVEWYAFSPVLAYVILLYGVFVGTYAIADVYNDLIARTVPGSDAYALYEETRCCLPKCVGVQWLVMAIGLKLLGLWLALVLMSDHCYERGWMECVFSETSFFIMPDFLEDIHMDRWFE